MPCVLLQKQAKALNFAPRTLQIYAVRKSILFAEISLKWKRKVCCIPMITTGMGIQSIIPLSLMNCSNSFCFAAPRRKPKAEE